MRSTDIRNLFFDFFSDRDHRRVPSGSLIPHDPTLLLTNAGMAPFKSHFLGESTPEHPRAMSVQKCARTVDIDNVGRTRRHATFFEMLGNFSFNDYFKTDAIAWAYELATGGYGLEPDRLWATVYRDDDEAVRLWRKVGIPEARIQRLDMADNYWSMGVPGPCGPCSELFYDRGEAYGPDGGPAVDSERFLEIWNLVFMQHLRGEGDGKDGFEIVGDLPANNVDTGLGVDRMAMILQGVDNVCETDLTGPTLTRLQELTGRDYADASPEHRVSFRIVAEHSRSAAFLIADGVLPSNEGRGHVLRRLLRRAVRHARLLGHSDHVMGPLAGDVVDNLGDVWPELIAQRALIEKVVIREEDAFARTLRQGSRLLQTAVTRARTRGERVLPATTAFELHDTYGFPVDLTVEIARDSGLDVDRDRLAALMDEQRQRAKTSRPDLSPGLRRLDVYREIASRHGRTTFVGYDELTAEATLLGLLVAGDGASEAAEGQQVEVILDRSPLYAEAGGQVGDTGLIRTADGAQLRVTKTRYGIDGLHVHTAEVVDGLIRSGDQVLVNVDTDRRAATARSHSATHVLHATLRQTLGDHARQHGSLVEPGRLRFDFTHFDALDADRLASIEEQVNQRVLGNPKVRVWHATRAEAEAAGAAAFFGEKYGEVVRVVDIGDFSRELCGGTHVGQGSQAGPVRITTEASIGAGIRRVEALTGIDALRHADHERRILAELRRLLGARPDTVIDQLATRLAALADAERRLAAFRQTELATRAVQLAGKHRATGAGWVVAEPVADITAVELRPLAADVLSHGPADRPGAVILGCVIDHKAQLAAAINDRFADAAHLQAVDLLRSGAKLIGGGAGGAGLVANAGGRKADKLAEALATARQCTTELLDQG